MMKRSVEIVNIGALRPYMDENVARDFIDLLYRGDERIPFIISGSPLQKKLRGRHIGSTTGHRIEICAENIIRDFNAGLPIGGNLKAHDAKMAVFQTFAHEIQHANQTHVHSSREGFWTRPGYRRRPCEQDARLFVDENLETIAAFLGITLPSRRVRAAADERDYELELTSLAEDLSEFESLSVRDLVEELREVDLNNPVNGSEDSSRLIA
jgi:hypothetical protein